MEIDSILLGVFFPSFFFLSRAMWWVPFLQRAGRRPDRGRAVHGALGQNERSAGVKAAGVQPEDEELGKESTAPAAAATAANGEAKCDEMI
jgi:hypothetical protein